MRQIRLFLLVVLCSVSLTNTFSQTHAVDPEGSVVYDLKLSGKDVDPMAAMMVNGSKLEMAFKGDMVRALMKMTLMKSTVVMDSKSQQGIMLMDMLGKKMAMKLDGTDQERGKELSKGKHIKHTDQTKMIAGHKCNLAYMVDDSTGEKYEVWYCPYLTVGKSAAAAGFNFEGIEGLPLEMDLDQDGMKLRMVAKTVTIGKQDAKLFTLEIPAGYEVMTEEDMAKMMK